MKTLIAITIAIFINPVLACESEPHAFFRVGAGYTNLEPDGELAAQIDLGFRWPTSFGSFDVRIGDHSHWFVGYPFNDDDEDSEIYLNIGSEWTF